MVFPRRVQAPCFFMMSWLAVWGSLPFAAPLLGQQPSRR